MEALDVVVELVETRLFRGQRDAHVRRVIQDLAQRVGLAVALVGVGHVVVVGGDGARAEHGVLGAHRPLLQDGERRDGLEGGSGLVGLGDGLHRFAAHLRRGHVGRVHVGQRARGVNLAGGGIHDDGRALLGLQILHALGERLFHGVLQLDVEGDHDVLAVDGRRLLLHAAGNGESLLAALGGVGARRAGKDVVVLQLEAGDALAVDVAVADDLAADGAVGVLAAGVGDEVDAVQLEFFDLIGHFHVGLALDVDEGGGRSGQKLAVVGRISPEHRGQRRRLGRRIGHLHGVRVDGGGLHRGGQHDAVAVVDGAAARRRLETDRAGLLGHGRVLIRYDDLQKHQAQEEHGRYGGESQQQHLGAPGDRRHGRVDGGAHACAGRARGARAPRGAAGPVAACKAATPRGGRGPGRARGGAPGLVEGASADAPGARGIGTAAAAAFVGVAVAFHGIRAPSCAPPTPTATGCRRHRWRRYRETA